MASVKTDTGLQIQWKTVEEIFENMSFLGFPHHTSWISTLHSKFRGEGGPSGDKNPHLHPRGWTFLLLPTPLHPCTQGMSFSWEVRESRWQQHSQKAGPRPAPWGCLHAMPIPSSHRSDPTRPTVTQKQERRFTGFLLAVEEQTQWLYPFRMTQSLGLGHAVFSFLNWDCRLWGQEQAVRSRRPCGVYF